MKLKLILLLMLCPSLCFSAENEEAKKQSSEFVVWEDLQEMEPLKAAWDFNFDNPGDVHRALNPIVLAINANAEHGPLSLDPMPNVVVSHGGEAVIWAKKNYKQFKEVIDRARRIHEMGVRFEVCNVVAQAQGFDADDYHDFIKVVPTGSYALIYWANKGYAVIPAGSTTPVRPVNEHNKKYLGKP